MTPSPSPSAPAISVAGLHRSFGDHAVLDGIDLSVPAGTIYSLLGPNGAGKTTTVHILSTLLRADRGTVLVGGHDVARDPDGVRSVIGVTGQFSAVDNLLTGAENMAMMGRLHHLPRDRRRHRAATLLERFGLTDAAGKFSSEYSGGMRRRLDLAMSLMGDARIVFLDEPTTGLDPRSRRDMWEVIRGLVDEGVTIFLTTQYLEEADHLADTVAVLDGGKLVAEGTPTELKRLVPGGHVTFRFASPAELQRAGRVLGVPVAGTDDLALQVPGAQEPAALRDLLGRLHREDVPVEGLAVHAPNLDDVFLTLTGRPAGDTGSTDPGTTDTELETVK